MTAWFEAWACFHRLYTSVSARSVCTVRATSNYIPATVLWKGCPIGRNMDGKKKETFCRIYIEVNNMPRLKPVTAETRFRSQASASGICLRKSGT